jgi:ribonuclease J
MEKGKEKYVLVVTGHQGEPKAILSRMAKGETPFKFSKEDFIVFSCKVIPTQLNAENRNALEEELKKTGVRLFKDIHVSGHSAREDLKDLLIMIKPKNVIPAHCSKEMKEGMAELCYEMGYKKENIRLIRDGDTTVIQS